MAEPNPGDYITFRELVDREEALRKQMRDERSEAINGVKADMTNRFSIFGHEVAKQFVDERERNRREAPQPQEDPNLRKQITEMASGKHGRGMMFVGIGLIAISLAVLAHAPFMKGFTPFG